MQITGSRRNHHYRPNLFSTRRHSCWFHFLFTQRRRRYFLRYFRLVLFQASDWYYHRITIRHIALLE